MGSQVSDIQASAAAIVARIPAGEMISERIAAEIQSRIAAFEHLSEESRADVVDGIRRTLRRWRGSLSTGVMPPDSDLDQLREWTRARAAEGVRLEDLLRLVGVVHRLSWQLLCDYARSDEFEVLLRLAGPVGEYADRISAVATETYLAERELLVSEGERSTRRLLDRLCVDTPLDPSERELADSLGVPLERAYSPFALSLPGRPSHRYAALAARLRQRGWSLAVTQSDRVVGLTWRPLDLPDLNEGPEVLLAIGEPTPRAQLAMAAEELAVLLAHGLAMGLRGRLRADDYLLEILLARSPRLLSRLRAKVLLPLADDEHGELTETLRALLRCRMDRTATSSALHIHRNTLAYRLGRIEQITGLDLGCLRDLTSAYLALQAGAAPGVGGPSR
jgi:PucR C-terminal helix-turn-helix domain